MLKVFVIGVIGVGRSMMWERCGRTGAEGSFAVYKGQNDKLASKELT